MADNEDLLILAARKGDLNRMRSLLGYGLNVNLRGTDGETPLHESAREGQLSMMEFLLAEGADVNAVNDTGTTPLFSAVSGKRLDAVDLLIKAGADVSFQETDTKWTALHRAALRGSAPIVERLINAGAQIEAIDKDGQTPLFCAVRAKRVEVVECLLNHEANPHLTSRLGSVESFMEADEPFYRMMLTAMAQPGTRHFDVLTDELSKAFREATRGYLDMGLGMGNEQTVLTCLQSIERVADRHGLLHFYSLDSGPFMELRLHESEKSKHLVAAAIVILSESLGCSVQEAGRTLVKNIDFRPSSLSSYHPISAAEDAVFAELISLAQTKQSSLAPQQVRKREDQASVTNLSADAQKQYFDLKQQWPDLAREMGPALIGALTEDIVVNCKRTEGGDSASKTTLVAALAWNIQDPSEASTFRVANCLHAATSEIFRKWYEQMRADRKPLREVNTTDRVHLNAEFEIYASPCEAFLQKILQEFPGSVTVDLVKFLLGMLYYMKWFGASYESKADLCTRSIRYLDEAIQHGKEDANVMEFWRKMRAKAEALKT